MSYRIYRTVKRLWRCKVRACLLILAKNGEERVLERKHRDKSKGEKKSPNIGLKKRPQVQTWAEVQVGSLSKPVHLTLVISIFAGTSCYAAKGKSFPG